MWPLFLRSSLTLACGSPGGGGGGGLVSPGTFRASAAHALGEATNGLFSADEARQEELARQLAGKPRLEHHLGTPTNCATRAIVVLFSLLLSYCFES